MVCTVTGQISDIFADAMGELTVEFKTTQRNLWRSGQDVVSTKRKRVKTDEAGALSVDLLPGEYTVTLRTNAQGGDETTIVVPEAETAFLHQLINLPTPTDPNALEQAVLDAQAARDAANAAVVEAQDIIDQGSVPESAYDIAIANGFVGTEIDWLNSLNGSDGSDGLDGAEGNNGWSPVLATVSDGDRRVHQVVDWAGGEGIKPSTGVYLGATGFVALIADAADVRGPAGNGAGDMIGANNLTDVANAATALSNLGGSPVGHTHAANEVVGLPALQTTVSGLQSKEASWDSAVAWGNHSLVGYLTGVAWGDITSKPVFATVATSGSYGDLSGLPTLGTSAPLNVAAAGNAGANEVVVGDDSRLSDARTPTAHTHEIVDVTGLQTALNNKASSSQGALADSALQSSDIGVSVQGYSAILAATTASFTTADETKLDGIETGATADQTGAEIKAAYEGEPDTNAYTNAEKSKLAGIEAGADVTDAINVAAAGALMDSEVANLVEVKAFDPTDYATAAQGALADSAAQEADVETTTINAQTGTTYTLALTDRGQTVTMDSASANTVTIPTNASVAFATGSVVTVIQKGAGVTTITGATGVTVNGVSAGSGDMSAQWQGVAVMKIATDEWVVSGAIGTVA